MDVTEPMEPPFLWLQHPPTRQTSLAEAHSLGAWTSKRALHGGSNGKGSSLARLGSEGSWWGRALTAGTLLLPVTQASALTRCRCQKHQHKHGIEAAPQSTCQGRPRQLIHVWCSFLDKPGARGGPYLALRAGLLTAAPRLVALVLPVGTCGWLLPSGSGSVSENGKVSSVRARPLLSQAHTTLPRGTWERSQRGGTISYWLVDRDAVATQ